MMNAMLCNDPRLCRRGPAQSRMTGNTIDGGWVITPPASCAISGSDSERFFVGSVIDEVPANRRDNAFEPLNN